MAFDPENPVKPQDLYATFDINDNLSGLIYRSPDEGSFSRINGEWLPLTPETNPFGMGANVVFVDPSFTIEFDSRMMYREFIGQKQVQEKFGVKPDFDIKF
jgi:hypothetical protein